jgi:hypothetical protein
LEAALAVAQSHSDMSAILCHQVEDAIAIEVADDHRIESSGKLNIADRPILVAGEHQMALTVTHQYSDKITRYTHQEIEIVVPVKVRRNSCKGAVFPLDEGAFLG